MAKGSHQTLPSWAPRDCAVCGKRVLSRKGFWLWREPEQWGVSLHHDCVRTWMTMQVEGDESDQLLLEMKC